jgi:hypothetical protein
MSTVNNQNLKDSKVAIMQPYLFPYMGYFQLIHSVDTFVFYDDVNFINRGWINRNRILSNNSDLLFTLPLKNASQNKLINEIETDISEKWKRKFLRTLHHCYYNKAPYFLDTFELVDKILSFPQKSIGELAEKSVTEICEYIGLKKKFLRSSSDFSGTKGLEKADRLIEISHKVGSKIYINMPGGSEIYRKDFFLKKEINLYFIKPEIVQYKQINENFTSALSIVDVLMFNSVEEVLTMLDNYELI